MSDENLEWIAIGREDDLPEGRVKSVTARTVSICLSHSKMNERNGTPDNYGKQIHIGINGIVYFNVTFLINVTPEGGFVQSV